MSFEPYETLHLESAQRFAKWRDRHSEVGGKSFLIDLKARRKQAGQDSAPYLQIDGFGLGDRLQLQPFRFRGPTLVMRGVRRLGRQFNLGTDHLTLFSPSIIAPSDT